MIEIVPIGVACAIAIFAIGLVLEARARRRPAAALDTPPSLYPRINTDVCICSGSCVTVCPEGDVLAIVDGRPRLVQASACVGHGDCLRSCPVDAIELVLGSRERAVEVPVASSSFETTVPGLYVAGEITGMGLIHNAVAQGRQAAAAALARMRPHSCELDLAIIGAGPAGIAAALEARRRGVRCAVFEKGDFGGAIRSYPRQKVVMAAPLELPGIGRVELRRTSKEALLAMFRRVVRTAQLPIVEHAEVTSIEQRSDGLVLDTAAGPATAHRVILAIGRRGTPRRLAVPGAELPHVVHEVRDPRLHAGQRLVVVGGGDSAAELALALAVQPRTRVALVHRGRDLGRCKPDNRRAIERARASGRLAVYLETTIREITSDQVAIAGPTGDWELTASLVVCCLGSELPSRWLRGLGVGVRELRGEPLRQQG